MAGRTLGQHLASRLVELGLTDYFTVPGDFNLVLLDQLLKEPKLRMINTCNELNAGYAADGYARARGVACCISTFTVGSLSLINAIAGACSESLPIICVVGGPNSNDYGTNRILHHTIGLKTSFHQEHEAFKPFTCAQVSIFTLEDAHEQIDWAIAEAMRQKKPCYISVSCNIAGIPYPTFDVMPVPYALTPKLSNQRSLHAAVDKAAEFLNSAVKPVLVGGVQMRLSKACSAFKDLADASGYAVAVMPNAKGMFPESHEAFIGTFWGQVSTPYCSETVESSDAYLFAGPIFNDYTSVGYSLLIKKEKMIQVSPTRVTIGGHYSFSCVNMADFLAELAKRVKRNTATKDNHSRMFVPPGEVPPQPADSPLRTNVLFKHVQSVLTPSLAIMAETGDSWFNCQKLKLPDGCGFEFQMQYGSIGWSVGASLGYSAALQGKQRVMLFVGDGSFQVTAQDMSTMIRFGLNPIVCLINNKGYTIEVEIHDGPYNNIKDWDYCGLINAFHNGEGKVLTALAKTEEQFEKALHAAIAAEDTFCFIECQVHRDDCSKELLEWGSRVAAANGRPPNPQ